jgi:hypothetical protein
MADRDARRSCRIGRPDDDKNYLAAKHGRLTRRRGMGRAQVAVARRILVCAYWMLTRDLAYHDLGPDWHERRNNEAHTRRLIAQLDAWTHCDHQTCSLTGNFDKAPDRPSRCSMPSAGRFTGLCAHPISATHGST